MKFTAEDIYRYSRGEFTEKEKLALNNWLAESPDNRKVYKDARKSYQMLLVGYDMDGIDRRMHEEAARLRYRRRHIFIAVADIAAAVAFFFGVMWYASDRVDRRINESMIVTAVPEGQRMDLTLDDGTKVCLNAGTTLEYPPVFVGKERKVRLDGEAKFKVTHDSGHPFLVETHAADVRVVGTEFVINAEQEENIFTASLIEGCVKVFDRKDKDATWTLKPNQTITLESGRFKIENRLDSQALYWTEGLFNLKGIGFGELMRRMERAYGVDIVIRRQQLPKMDCSGEIRISDGVENALTVLRLLTDFTYSRDEATGTIYID